MRQINVIYTYIQPPAEWLFEAWIIFLRPISKDIAPSNKYYKKIEYWNIYPSNLYTDLWRLLYIYGSFHVRTTSKNGSYLSNPVDVGMWGVQYDITLHAKRNVSSTFSYQDILPKIFDLGKHYAFCNIFQSKSFSRTNKKIYRLKVIDFKKFLLFFLC